MAILPLTPKSLWHGDKHMKMQVMAAMPLCLGLIVAGTLAAQGAGISPKSELEQPVRIEADGVPIDTGKDIGHPGPLVLDYDNDGLQDLLVSAFRGNIRFFKNVGTRRNPKFQEGKPLAAGGEPIRIHNW
jgi:hypothetical protein